MVEKTMTLKGLKCPKCNCEDLKINGKPKALAKEMTNFLLFGGVGNIVASKMASKNYETVALSYECKKCKHKFESMPLIALEEDILESPCTINFTRLNSFIGCAGAQMVYLNGVNCGPVENGKTITLKTDSRWNKVFVTDPYGVAFPDVYCFEAVPNGVVNLNFKRKFV